MNKAQAQKLMTVINNAITEVVTIIDEWELENDKYLNDKSDLNPVFSSLEDVDRWLNYAKNGVKNAVREQQKIDEDQPF